MKKLNTKLKNFFAAEDGSLIWLISSIFKGIISFCQSLGNIAVGIVSILKEEEKEKNKEDNQW